MISSVDQTQEGETVITFNLRQEEGLFWQQKSGLIEIRIFVGHSESFKERTCPILNRVKMQFDYDFVFLRGFGDLFC